MGLVANRNKALRTGCVCYRLPGKDEELMCYSPGVVGVLNNAQELQFCQKGKEIRQASKNLVQSQKRFSTAVEKAGDKFYRSKQRGIAQWGRLLEDEFGKPGKEVRIVAEIGEDIHEIPVEEPEVFRREPKPPIPKFKPIPSAKAEVEKPKVSKPKVPKIEKEQKAFETTDTFMLWIDQNAGNVIELDRIWDIIAKNKNLSEEQKTPLFNLIETSYDIRTVPKKKEIQIKKPTIVTPAVEKPAVVKGVVEQPVPKAKKVSKEEFKKVEGEIDVVKRADYYSTAFMNPYKTEAFINSVREEIKKDPVFNAEQKASLLSQVDSFWKDKNYAQETPMEEELTEPVVQIVGKKPTSVEQVEAIGGTELPPQQEILATATQVGKETLKEHVEDFSGMFMVIGKDYREALDKNMRDQFDKYRNSILNKKGRKTDLEYIGLLVDRDELLSDDLKAILKRGVELNLHKEPYVSKKERFIEVRE